MSNSLIENGVRQGALIPLKGFSDIDIIKNCRAFRDKREKDISDNAVALVLSQDCDIFNKNESTIEIVILEPAKKREANDERIQKTRSTKKIVLNDNEQAWLCSVDQICWVPKQLFLDCTDWTKSISHIAESQKEQVITWRINRYRRVPLPDNFNKDFFQDYIWTPGNGLQKSLEANHESISDLYAYVYPRKEGASKYWVSLTVLLRENTSDARREVISTLLKEHVKILHESKNSLHMLQEDWEDHNVADLPTLELVAHPEDFTIADLNRMARLTLDYLCWPDDGSQ